MGREPRDESRSGSSPAEEAFAEHLRRREAGESVDLDAVCREHPELAEELRELHAAWSEADHLLGDRLSAETPDSAVISTNLMDRLEAQRSVRDRYTLRGEVARGGQGAILRVRDEDLRRDLAMKVILGRSDPSGARR